MSRLILTPSARSGLERCRLFLAGKNGDAAKRAAHAIMLSFDRLTAMPEMGRPIDIHPGLREFLIPFGDSGYCALYRYVAEDDLVVILAFRHMREAGY